MYIANIQPKNVWTEITALIAEAIDETAELIADNTYTLYNNGGDTVYIVVQELEPTVQTTGLALPAGHSYKFKYSHNCYLRASHTCDLCVMTED